MPSRPRRSWSATPPTISTPDAPPASRPSWSPAAAARAQSLIRQNLGWALFYNASVLPLAISGALLVTYFGWTSINIYSQVGFITLVGLIAKNAILIVEFARQVQDQGATKLAAIRSAATTRLRPVLMTTGATVMGHFPLVLVEGPGAAARNSIGIVLVAGMLIGTLFTLFILPSVYMWLAEDRSRAPAPSAEPVPAT